MKDQLIRANLVFVDKSLSPQDEERALARLNSKLHKLGYPTWADVGVVLGHEYSLDSHVGFLQIPHDFKTDEAKEFLCTFASTARELVDELVVPTIDGSHVAGAVTSGVEDTEEHSEQDGR